MRLRLIFPLPLLCWLLSVVNGYPRFGDQFPNGRNVPHPCRGGEQWQGVGHLGAAGGGARNSFGLDFLQAGEQWTQALCRGDSDGDGRTNGQELGDPDCLWSPGHTPNVTTGITHPGVCEPVDSPQCQTRPMQDARFATQQEWMQDECRISTTFHCPAIHETENVQEWDVRLPHSNVPPQETTYLCVTYEFPDVTKDYHIIGQDSLVNNSDVIHHILIYGCDDDMAVQGPHECDMSRCPDFLMGWGVGTSGKCLIDEAGIRFGRTGIKKVLVEYHWNNPEKSAHHWDSSGMRLYYTDQLRQYDMGCMMLGEMWLAIPPGSTDATFTSECSSTCTSSLMRGMVNITNVYDHMHLHGERLTIELWRDGEFVQTISDGKNYRYDNPSTHNLEQQVVVRPGDVLRTTCHYATTDINTTLTYGQSTADEMCISFLSFYPAQNMPRHHCMTWRSLSLDNCDPEPFGGCNFILYNDVDQFARSSFYVSIMDACDGFSYCKVECKAAIRRAREQEPCLRGDPWELLRWYSLRVDDRGLKFLAALESCKVEMALEDLHAQLLAEGQVDNEVNTIDPEHQPSSNTEVWQHSGGSTGANQQPTNRGTKQRHALFLVLVAVVTTILSNKSMSAIVS